MSEDLLIFMSYMLSDFDIKRILSFFQKFLPLKKGKVMKDLMQKIIFLCRPERKDLFLSSISLSHLTIT